MSVCLSVCLFTNSAPGQYCRNVATMLHRMGITGDALIHPDSNQDSHLPARVLNDRVHFPLGDTAYLSDLHSFLISFLVKLFHGPRHSIFGKPGFVEFGRGATAPAADEWRGRVAAAGRRRRRGKHTRQWMRGIAVTPGGFVHVVAGKGGGGGKAKFRGDRYPDRRQ